MKPTILLLAGSLVVFGSCTTAYKTGQTPDDVYYSPTKQNTDKHQKDEEEYVQSNDQPTRYDDSYYEDRYLHMKVRNRYRWNDLNDWYYSDYRNRYNVYMGCCFCNSGWSPYTHWNTYYNPYYQNYNIVKNVRTVTYQPRTFNLNTYNPKNTRNYNPIKYGSSSSGSSSSSSNNTYTAPRNNNERNRSTGSRLRDLFTGSNSSNSSSSGSSGSSSSGSSGSSGSSNSSSSSSSSSSGGSKAPVRKF